MNRINEIAHGILHLQDAMGVCMTLVMGQREALLLDTGYGMEDIRQTVESLTDLQWRVLLTHGHHDHVLGSRYFDRCEMLAQDLEEFRQRTGEAQRQRVVQQAQQKHVSVPADYLQWSYRDPVPLQMTGKTGSFSSESVSLGGREILLLHVPGHTPGSLMAYLPDERLLLTGDNWNPCTWLWFPSSLGLSSLHRNLQELLLLLPFERVLCSHQPGIRSRLEIERILDAIEENAVSRAERVDMGSDIDTRKLNIDEETGSCIVFDWNKRLQ